MINDKPLPKLYIRDSKGKPREWFVRTEGDKVIVSHGLVGGKIVEKVTAAKPKNVGKANETSAEGQAILEAASKWRHQIEREDYHEDIELSGLQLRPQLALDYLKVPNRVNWSEAVAQPKLDGLRLTAGNRYTDGRDSPFEMMTRKGESYKVPHLIDGAEEILKLVNEKCGGKCIALDGEAYLHGLPLQKISSLARKYKAGETEELEYHLFDLVIPGMSFDDRYRLLKDAVCEYGDHKLFSVVPCHNVHLENIGTLQGKYLEEGYEGLMIRHLNSEYAIGNRSPDLFKFKQFFDDEFKIISVWEDKSGNAMFGCIMKSGDGFDCTPKRTHDERKEILKNKDEYIGKWLTVKYQGFSVDGIPQFPVGLELRDCDEDGSPIV